MMNLNNPEWVDDTLDYLENKYNDSFHVSATHDNIDTTIYEVSDYMEEYYVYPSVHIWNKTIKDHIKWMHNWHRTRMAIMELNIMDYVYYDKKHSNIRLKYKKIVIDTRNRGRPDTTIYQQLKILNNSLRSVIISPNNVVMSRTLISNIN